MTSDGEANESDTTAVEARPPTREELRAAIRVLEALADDRGALAGVSEEERRRLLVAAGRVSRPERAEQRKLAKAFRRKERDEDRAHDEELCDETGIRAGRRALVFATPAAPVGALPEAPAEPPSQVVDAPPSSPRVEVAEPPSGPGSRPGLRDGEPPSAPGPGSRPGLRDGEPPSAPGPELREPRKCYVCKAAYRRLHFFYDQLCVPCGDFNHRKRAQTAPLDGRVALITGSRVKIGYQAGILLLRAGARLVVTTRFPHDAAERYAREVDHDAWKDRLDIYGLDLRHTPSVELFAQHLGQRLDRLDFVLHNACQTVRRPSGFYTHLMEGELRPLSALPAQARPLLQAYDELRRSAEPRALAPSAPFRHAEAGLRDAALLSQAPLAPEDTALTGRLDIFPEGRLDQDLQQVDLRETNSWRLKLADVPTLELLEVQLVNAIAPFVLNARLKALMLRAPSRDKHIVNVSAMEGQFYRDFKTDRHPHTNMAKAALNMMTRTSAADYAKDGIHMNSVDTGWVTDEDPALIAARKQEEHGFHPPLDIVDGAARIVDPIFAGFLSGTHASGQFFKDYFPTSW